MERLLVVWCPDILEEQEHGREARVFGAVVAALETFAARVDPVRPGVCAVPTRGPSRYFGGDGVLASMAAEAVAGVGVPPGRDRRPAWGWPTGCSPPSWPPGPRSAPGPVIVPPGETPSFLAPWPVATLERPGARRPARPSGDPHPGRVRRRSRSPRSWPGSGPRAPCASGWPGGPRGSSPASGCSSPASAPGGPAAAAVTRQAGFWGDTADADARAARAVAGVQGCSVPRPSSGVGSKADGARASGPGSSPGPGPGGGGWRPVTAGATAGAGGARGRGRSLHRRPPWSSAGRCPPCSPTAPAGPWGSPAAGWPPPPPPGCRWREGRGPRSPGGPGPGRPTSGGGRSGAGAGRPACRSSPPAPPTCSRGSGGAGGWKRPTTDGPGARP